MRINCPLCGERDLAEFHYEGSSKLMVRPKDENDTDAFHDYLHIRSNTAGLNNELWSHEYGCRAWLLICRDTNTHKILSIDLTRDKKTKGSLD